jgi:lipid II:glycine glycyltransferase (peptidoglycan interpeptide bridge formation enzyme)
LLDAFRAIYRRTMTHLEAMPYYLFSDAYFEHLATSLEERARIFIVSDSSGPIAAALFLVHGDAMHYHLGGSDETRRQSRPNNLLFHEAARWGQAHGCRQLHLGGGRTTNPDDALLAFKRTLSRRRLRFELGRRVHDAAGYESLCAQWMKAMHRTERPNYFLLYRLDKAP